MDAVMEEVDNALRWGHAMCARVAKWEAGREG